jgi:hypothetical protein
MRHEVKWQRWVSTSKERAAKIQWDCKQQCESLTWSIPFCSNCCSTRYYSPYVKRNTKTDYEQTWWWHSQNISSAWEQWWLTREVGQTEKSWQGRERGHHVDRILRDSYELSTLQQQLRVRASRHWLKLCHHITTWKMAGDAAIRWCTAMHIHGNIFVHFWSDIKAWETVGKRIIPFKGTHSYQAAIICWNGEAFSFWYSEGLTRNEALGGISIRRWEEERRGEGSSQPSLPKSSFLFEVFI